MPVGTFSTADQQRLATLQKYPLAGHCQGRFAFSSVPNDFLQSLLPSDLVLASQNYTPAGQHPLLFMFNNTWLHTNPNLVKIVATENVEMKLNYFEFIVMIPYVQFSDNEYNSNAPYCFLPILYLNNILAVLGGRVFWEFNKQMAGFTVGDGDFFVTEESTNELLLSSTSLMAGFLQPNKSVSNFQDIVPILQLPVIEHGPYGYVSSIYKIGLDNTEIAPTGILFKNQSCNFMPSGLTSSPSIQENQLGAFLMEYDWALSYIEFIKF